MRRLTRAEIYNCFEKAGQMASHLNSKLRRMAAIGLCGAVLFGLAAAPARADEPRHVLEFANYRQAVATGDAAAAEQHAYAAWRAAETELGAASLTSTLAFNYGREIALGAPALARPALNRAQELMDSGLGGASQSLLALYKTYADFALGDPKDRKPEALRDALLAAEQAPDRRISHEIALWLEYAKAELARENYEAAATAAGKAETEIVLSAPENTAGLAEAFLVRGIAAIMPKRRTLKDAVTAREYFENGERLFQPQKSFDRFDPTFAKLAGWKVAADGVILSLASKDDPAAKPSRGKNTTLFEVPAGQPADCLIRWAARTAPDYPRGAIQKSHIGAVIAVFDLADDNAVHNLRILSEVPSKTFSDAVLKAMQDWRLQAPSLAHPGCRKNNTTQFTFVIEE